MTSLSATPVRYSPDVETLRDDEDETRQELVDVVLRMTRQVADDTGHAERGVHAKSHGLFEGELQVLDNLPPELAQGICASPKTYPVVMRLSTPPAEKLDDNVSLPRGIAIKLLGVEGARVEGSEGDSTQDFLMIDGPTFTAKDARGFLKNLKLLASTTDRVPGLKRVLSTVLQGAEKALEAVGGQSSTLIAMGGHPEVHPLGATFFSQVPIRWGDYIAKLQLLPVSPALVELEDQKIDIDGKPDGTREAVMNFTSSQDLLVWDLRVQLCVDLEKMPVEDATVQWPEDLSPFVPVARLTLRRQPGWSEALEKRIDDGMAFSPWHALDAHRPLGHVMRSRRRAYEESARFRGEFNGCPMHEPRAGGPAASASGANPAS